MKTSLTPLQDGPGYELRFQGIEHASDSQKQMTTAALTVFVGGKEMRTMHPAKWAFKHHEEEPTTEVEIGLVGEF